MLGYFSMNVICFEKETVFQGTENYPSILSRQMGVIEIVIPRKYFATRETKRLAKAFRLRLRHGMLSFQLVYFSVTPAESSPFLHLSLKEAFLQISPDISQFSGDTFDHKWKEVKRENGLHEIIKIFSHSVFAPISSWNSKTAKDFLWQPN